MMLTSVPIVVLSHLRWDFVCQRPQHLLTRLAAGRPVYYVEEPIHDAGGRPHWVFHSPAPNVLVCQPYTPETEPGFSAAQLPVLRQLMAELAAEHNIREAIAWFYTPLAWPLLDTLPQRAIVYDCMDELSLFLNAPAALLENEAQLLARADVVFTGGPSLFRAKRGRSPNVHCFPSSVEVEHFQPARPGARPALAEPADQRDLARPRLGYYGVIDERMDLGLLDALAQARPDWQIVLVGPVV